MTMQYKSQKMTQNFYTFAILLFLVQILVGIIGAVQFIWPDFFILKFHIIKRAVSLPSSFFLSGGKCIGTVYPKILRGGRNEGSRFAACTV